MASTQTKGDSKATESKPEQQTVTDQKTTAALEEDDEFEDFPVDDWATEDTEAAANQASQHLWEESWDDDDTSDDFSQQLKEELKKVDATKKR
ncbi:DSS1/SEM1 family-domain-containing protein [Rhypophila decipiens]|uniref:26S proteasome complex subunit SEM1 n=1 Tax=Rhypophila decipiens TaxID=261697 RepID=A0AAN6Y5L7_9PEZI|nr:DSS1/SEM1 family-domain-containing protein [Rhypophila decipiens]